MSRNNKILLALLVVAIVIVGGVFLYKFLRGDFKSSADVLSPVPGPGAPQPTFDPGVPGPTALSGSVVPPQTQSGGITTNPGTTTVGEYYNISCCCSERTDSQGCVQYGNKTDPNTGVSNCRYAPGSRPNPRWCHLNEDGTLQYKE